MKKGKSVKLNLSTAFKSLYGTVDSKELKSVYVNIQSWVSPKEDLENWNRIVCNLSREIGHTVFNTVDKNIFNSKSIVDLDLRTSGIKFGKKSFLNLEINLFTEKQVEFKSNELKNSIRKLIKSIESQNIKSNEYFDFTLTKK